MLGEILIGSKLKTLFAAIIAVIAPIAMFYHIIILLLSINVIIDIWRIKKVGLQFDAKMLLTYITRVIVYCVVITIIFLFEKFVIFNLIQTNSTYLTTVSVILLCLFEFDKLLTNASILTNNPIFINIKNILNKLVKGKKYMDLENDKKELE
jgi:hypothetical protein